MQILVAVQTQTQLNVQVTQQLAAAIAALESRIQAWEQWFLPEVMERLPPRLPPSPASRSEHDAPTQPYVQPSHEHEPASSSRTQQPDGPPAAEGAAIAQGDQHQQGDVNMTRGDEEHVPAPTQESTVLNLLQERSLATQCAKVVKPALRPFSRS